MQGKSGDENAFVLAIVLFIGPLIFLGTIWIIAEGDSSNQYPPPVARTTFKNSGTYTSSKVKKDDEDDEDDELESDDPEEKFDKDDDDSDNPDVKEW